MTRIFIRRPRSALLGCAVLCLMAAALDVAHRSQASAAAWNLNGHWTGSAGNVIDRLSQYQTTVKWVAYAGDGSWVQEFTGTLNGTTISGSFTQDAPNVEPQRYHGTITAQVLDDCQIKITLVTQAGVSNAGGELFTKTGCTLPAPQPAPAAHYLFRFLGDNHNLHFSTGSTGSFTTTGQPGPYGDVTITNVKAPSLTLTTTTSTGTHRLSFRFTGHGTYAPTTHLLYLDLADPSHTVCRDSTAPIAVGINDPQPGLVTLHLCTVDFTLTKQQATASVTQG